MSRMLTHYIPWIGRDPPNAWRHLDYVVWENKKDVLISFNGSYDGVEKRKVISESEKRRMELEGKIIEINPRIILHKNGSSVLINNKNEVYLADIEDPENDSHKVRLDKSLLSCC